MTQRASNQRDERDERDERDNRDWRPVPDPTLLTTAQLREAIAALREIIETRFEGMDKAIKLLQDINDQLPSRIDEKVHYLQRLHDERFKSIDKQFAERDVRVEKTADQVSTAVTAAFQAAKEVVTQQNVSAANAISKSENATQKQLDQLAVQQFSAAKALEDKIADAKERITRIESLGIGRAVATQEEHSVKGDSRSATSLIAALIFGVFGVLVGIASIIIAVLRSP